MRESGVRVVFSPENPSRLVSSHRRAHRAANLSGSNGATNERTSKVGPIARPKRGHALRHTGEFAANVRKRIPPEERLKRVSRVFAALADQQRLKILLALAAAEELCVGEVAHVLRASVSVSSHHLRKLRDLGILRHRSHGKLAYYSLGQRYVAGLAVAALGAAAN
jgi:DNA-binding transcriptional ArsR family regulator